MEIISGVTEFHIDKRCVVTLGKFDGIHMGHMALINAAGKLAREHDLALAVFTFDVLPGVVFGKKDASQITTNLERRRLFMEAGVQYLIEFPFNNETSSMEPFEFIKKVIYESINAAYVVVGIDWQFGKDRTGNVDTLLSARKLFNFEVVAVEKEQYNGREISSTWIRDELISGNMENVNILLGYPYTIVGTVEHGKKMGGEMGFPTANIYPDSEKLLPPNGVYSVKVICDEKEYTGVANIGYRPTVENSTRLALETHIFDFEGDIYGKTITVMLYHFQRPEMKFETLEKLVAQINADKEFAKSFLLV